MFQGGGEAEQDYLARMLGSERLCVIASGSQRFSDPDAEMIRLHVIARLRDSKSRLKLLEALKANDNFTFEELLNLIHYRTHAKRFAER